MQSHLVVMLDIKSTTSSRKQAQFRRMIDGKNKYIRRYGIDDQTLIFRTQITVKMLWKVTMILAVCTGSVFSTAVSFTHLCVTSQDSV